MNRRHFIQSSGAGLVFTSVSGINKINIPDSSPSKITLPLIDIDRQKLERSVQGACNWLTDIAQIKTDYLDPLTDINGMEFPYIKWKGSIRGEYTSERDYSLGKSGKFWSFCPVWHTGQAVKGLCLASEYFNNKKYRNAAVSGGDFIIDKQITNKEDEDFGLILAFEDKNNVASTSAIMECCDGLFALSNLTGDEKYKEAALNAISRVLKKMYAGNGLFYDGYDPYKRQNAKNSVVQHRTLVDDGVFQTAFQLTKDEKYKKCFLENIDRLLKEEYPEGNWIDTPPSSRASGKLHPRHAFWFGRPMWMAHKLTKNRKYLDCFNRACSWYTKSMRRDGGHFRNTSLDFNTNSFGHASSGTAVGCIMFHDQIKEFSNKENIEYYKLGLKYLMSMQLTDPKDPNLKGVIIEKILPPGGSDSSMIHIRDLGTIFFIQAAVMYLRDVNEL